MGSLMMSSLQSIRNQFPILKDKTYLISNSLGAMPSKAEVYLKEYTNRWAREGVRAWQEWWLMPEKIGDMVASLIGAQPGSVSMHYNVTSTHAIVASCFDFSPTRNKVVYTELDFPSVSYYWLAQRTSGANVVIVPTQDRIGVDLDQLLEAIDDKTLYVSVSHVYFRSAFIQNVKEIVKKCRRVGAYLILDIYQSAGVIPVHLEKWDVDFAIGGTLKWLCGGPGNAFLYVKPELANKISPRLTGWLSNTRPFDFNVFEHILTDGPYRFMNGTPNIPGLYAAKAGLEIIKEIGIECIRTNSMRQTQLLLEMGQERGWEMTAPTNAEKRAGTVAFDLANGMQVAEELISRNVLVDYRPNAGIRVSPHFYTSDEEIQKFFYETDDILRPKPLKGILIPIV